MKDTDIDIVGNSIGEGIMDGWFKRTWKKIKFRYEIFRSKLDYKLGRYTELKSSKEIDEYFKKLDKKN